MFSLRFLGSFSAQRREFLTAENFSTPPLSDELRHQLEGLLAEQSQDSQFKTTLLFWKRCLEVCRQLIFRIIYLNFLAALFLALSVIFSRYVLDFYEKLGIACALAVLYLASDVGANLCGYYVGILREQIATTLRAHILALINRKLLSIDRQSVLEFSKGNLKTLVSADIEAVNNFVISFLWGWLPSLSIVLVLGPLLVAIGGITGAVGLVISILQVPLAIAFSRILSRTQAQIQVSQDSLTTLLGEWLRNIRLVRYLGWQSQLSTEIGQRVRNFCKRYAVRHIWLCLIFGVTSAWWTVPLLGMLISGYVRGQTFSIGEFFALVWALNHVSQQLHHLPHSVYMYSAAAVSAKRLKDLLNSPDMSNHFVTQIIPADYSQKTPIRAHFQAASFGYKEVCIISELSLSLDLRQRTAIVGAVGSGKSTLLKALTGELAPQSGSTEIEFEDGERANLWQPGVYQTLRANLGYVTQEPFLSNASVAANIALHEQGDPLGLQRSVELAQMRSDILLFENGIQQEVGEIGINLSGGQKQRLNLARAIYSQRKILVLDDPLSAVDKGTEKHLVKAIQDLKVGVVLVSHRLHELDEFDRVLVLEKGKIVEDGSPSSLISNRDSRFMYYRMAFEAEEQHES